MQKSKVSFSFLFFFLPSFPLPLFLLWVLLFQTGCGTFLNIYHVSGYHSKALSSSSNKKMIISEENQFVFMWMRFDNAYVDKAFRKLQAQCPNQHISGIHTRHSTKDRILFWIHTIRIEGYCHS